MSGMHDFVMISEDEIPRPFLEETSGQLEYQSGASSALMSTEGSGFISHAITSGDRRIWQAETAGNPASVPSSSRTTATHYARFPGLEAESEEVSPEALSQHPSLARLIGIELGDFDGEPQSISGILEMNRSDASMLSATADNSLPIQFSATSTEAHREERNGLGVHSQEHVLQTVISGDPGNHDGNL